MKVKFVCDSGANIHSAREEIVDTEDWGVSEAEWGDMSDEQKHDLVKEWAYDRLEIYWDEDLTGRTWR
jgi:hypothetical protein